MLMAVISAVKRSGLWPAKMRLIRIHCTYTSSRSSRCVRRGGARRRTPLLLQVLALGDHLHEDLFQPRLRDLDVGDLEVLVDHDPDHLVEVALGVLRVEVQ